MPTQPQPVIVGGGIVGLSTAMALTLGKSPIRPLVIEKERQVAMHQTGHNSGVIHSGLYYRPGSLKARYTVSGSSELIEFCKRYGIAHDICGKVVVATSQDELRRLEELRRRGEANGVPGGVRMIGPEELRELEPHAAGIRALHVPATGIVDFGAVARRYADLVGEAGGEMRTSTRLLDIRRDGNAWALETTRGVIRASHLINCAGLYSDWVAGRAGSPAAVRIVPFRGEYYRLKKEREDLVKTLIYPVPDPDFPFLGVHFTRMIGGGVEAGPNAVLSLKREGYRKTDFDVSEAWSTLGFPGFWRLAAKYWRTGAGEILRSFSKRAFTRSLQRLLPALREDDLEIGGSGVRAQAIDRGGALLDDFAIESAEAAIHVLNAPSPAATASLPIGRAIAEEARRRFGW